MSSYETALKAWGLSRLKSSGLKIGFGSQIEVRIIEDTIKVEMSFDEGYACCGGNNPDCYCTFATSPTADVIISAEAEYEDPYRKGTLKTNVQTSIAADDFNFAEVLKEIVEAGGGEISS